VRNGIKRTAKAFLQEAAENGMLGFIGSFSEKEMFVQSNMGVKEFGAFLAMLGRKDEKTKEIIIKVAEILTGNGSNQQISGQD
jgi:hypothetical protein